MKGSGPKTSARNGVYQEKRREAGSLGMSLFLIPEGMIFVGLVFAFEVLRARNTAAGAEEIEGNLLLWLCGVAGASVTEDNFWIPEDISLPVYITLANTLLLLVSAYLMYRAVRYADQSRFSLARTLLIITALFGTTFVVVQGWEWSRMLVKGLDFQQSVFAAMFYTIIGAHATHVVGGLLFLLYCTGASFFQVPGKEIVHKLKLCRIYWFFVCFLWPFLYIVLYFE